MIHVDALIAQGTLLRGGDQPIRFDASLHGINVIQAAAPDGVAGAVNVSAPVLDIAGRLKGLSAQAVASFFFSSRRRHTRCGRDWSSDVCSSDLSLFSHDSFDGLTRGPKPANCWT